MIKFSGNNVLIHSISPVMTIPSRNGGQDFQKRELIIDDSWDKDGRHYANFVLIEFTGDKMRILDSYFPGQRVNVEGLLSGREYNNKIFNTIKGTGITPAQPQQQFAPAPMPGFQQPQQAQPQQQFAPAPMPGFQQPQQAQPQQPYNPPNGALGVNDLPFSTR